MTEEQIKQKFREIYPDYMRGDTPLSPFFDIWENAIETAEKENERLEKESINLKETIHFLQTQSELHTKQYKKEIQELIEAHEKDRELLLKHIDKYKEDLKKLRVAFIQVQAEYLLGKPITEIVETILGGE